MLNALDDAQMLVASMQRVTEMGWDGLRLYMAWGELAWAGLGLFLGRKIRRDLTHCTEWNRSPLTMRHGCSGVCVTPLKRI